MKIISHGEVAAATSPVDIRKTHAPDTSQALREESSPIRRIATAIPVAIVAMTITGFILVSATAPGLSVLQRFGIGLFIGMWSGPFFGIAAGTGLYHLAEERKQREDSFAAPAANRVLPVSESAKAA